MSVFHCPICPLIFEHRTEVEWHLRNEHRSRSDEQAALAADIDAATRTELDWALLRRLQSSRAGIAVTLVMRTTPATTMTRVDVARLRRLAFQARRVITSQPGGVPLTLEERFSCLVPAAEGLATQDGLVLLANADHLAVFHLPVTPVDRVVVEPTFATRDLESTLRRFPRYRVVLLGTSPRVFEGRGRRLVSFGDDGPAGDVCRSSHRDGKRAVRPERWVLRRVRREAGVRRADELLASRAGQTGDLPLIVGGDGRWRAQFRRQSHYRASIVGEVPTVHGKDAASDLAGLAQPHIGRLQADEQTALIGELRRADALGSVTWGFQSVWAAVHDRTADLVWVDEDCVCPGEEAGNGTEVRSIGDAEDPGAIDELIEAAAKRSIAVQYLAAGSIPGPKPIAARIRADVPAVRIDVPLAEAV